MFDGTKGLFKSHNSEKDKQYNTLHVFVMFGGRALQQKVSILICNVCVPLLADLFYSYEAYFMQEFVKENM